MATGLTDVWADVNVKANSTGEALLVLFFLLTALQTLLSLEPQCRNSVVSAAIHVRRLCILFTVWSFYSDIYFNDSKRILCNCTFAQRSRPMNQWVLPFHLRHLTAQPSLLLPLFPSKTLQVVLFPLAQFVWSQRTHNSFSLNPSRWQHTIMKPPFNNTSWSCHWAMHLIWYIKNLHTRSPVRE